VTPAQKHKQARERFYALAMQGAAQLAKEGKQGLAKSMKELVEEMKMTEQECDFPKTKGMKVNLN
jgi:hypothetical protein